MSWLRVCGPGEEPQQAGSPQVCVLESLVVCVHEEGVSEDRGQKSAVPPVWGLTWGVASVGWGWGPPSINLS